MTNPHAIAPTQMPATRRVETWAKLHAPKRDGRGVEIQEIGCSNQSDGSHRMSIANGKLPGMAIASATVANVKLDKDSIFSTQQLIGKRKNQ